MAQIRQISKKRNLESPDLYDKFQYVAKSIERFFFWVGGGFCFPYFHSQNLAKLFSEGSLL
jgi:hypothetical protein